MTYIKLYLSILVICLLTCISALAQTFSSNTNVDDFSETQIKQVLQRAQSQGLSDAQLINQAKSNGMSAMQTERLQTRIAEIRQKDGNTIPGIGADTTAQTTRKLNYKDSLNTAQQRENDLFESFRPKIFGADIFRNNKSNPFESSLKIATPVNYIVGPDDKLVISVSGKSVMNWNSLVSPDGNININGVGIVKVAGKTIEQVRIDIRNKLIANNYAIGRGTDLRVDLGDIRSIRVIVQGQVVKPGNYIVSSLASVMTALFQAGGPRDNGSFRNIQVIRNGRVRQRMDIYDYLVKDTYGGNITLQDQDIIRVPTYDIRVELKGEVKIPAFFEPIPGETLKDLINYSGGFTDQAYTARIKVDQVSNQQHRLIDVVEDDYKSYTPLRGDKYTVEKILNRYENRVTINGAVFRPDNYELQSGMTISQLIKTAGGLKEDAFTGRGSIVRLNPDNTTIQIPFNVNDILNKTLGDIVLQREDVVVISSIFDLRDIYRVSIKGEVRKPGDFAYADSMSVEDLIIKAGGFAEGASSNRIQIARRVFNANPTVRNSIISNVTIVDVDPSLKSSSVILKPYDIVSIFSSPGYEIQKNVVVEGEVMYPGTFTIKNKNETISDVIVRAGGITASADIDGSSLKRDNAAILGIDKTKIDSAQFDKDRIARLNRLQNAYKEGSKEPDSLYRNNYIGIDLRKILKKPGSTEDLILEDGDVIRVPKQQQIVRINGEVLYPSSVVYQQGKSFKGYVLNAGGYSPKALKRGAYVVYANGTVKGTHKFLFFNLHPKVKPGSEIYVSKKSPSANNTPQAILGFTTGLASLGAIVMGILSLNK